jgi:hypothetical protein
MSDRLQRILVATFVGVGLLRGAWWVVTTPVWSPIDEQGHFDFIESLGRLEGMPTVGKALVHPDVLDVAKKSSTSPWQSVPIPPDPRRSEWSAAAQSYDGAQPPLYYLLMAPVWRATTPLATIGQVYVLRVLTLMIALAAIPIIWLMGRELFPATEVGVLSAGLMSVLSGVNGNFATVANDALFMSLAAAALLALSRVAARGFTTKRVAMVGFLVGLTLLAKTTGLALAGVVIVTFVVAARRHRLPPKDLARSLVIAGGIAAALIAPWVISNLATYGGLTASKQLDAITGPLQSNVPLTLRGMLTRLRQAGHGFWDAQILATDVSRYALMWFGSTAAIGLLAISKAVRKRRNDEAVTLGWLFLTWPISFFTMAVVILGLSGGRSDIAGRHLYVALPAVIVGLAGSMVIVFGVRRAVAVLAVLVAIGLSFEAHDEPGLMSLIYSNGAADNLAPAVDQPYADRVVDHAEVTVRSPCPIVAVRLVFVGSAPRVGIAVPGEPARQTDPLPGEPGEDDTTANLYPVRGAPTSATISVPQGARLAVSKGVGKADVETVDGYAPAARVLCVTPDNYDFRFARTFRRGHLPLTRAEVAFPPRAWALVGWIAAAMAIANEVFASPRSRSDS